jgi:hypothetical protein
MLELCAPIHIDVCNLSHYKTYSLFVGAILDKPCKASPNQALLQT